MTIDSDLVSQVARDRKRGRLGATFPDAGRDAPAGITKGDSDALAGSTKGDSDALAGITKGDSDALAGITNGDAA
jgi:hypothetical protein